MIRAGSPASHEDQLTHLPLSTRRANSALMSETDLVVVGQPCAATS